MNTPYTTKSGLQIGCNYQQPTKIWEPSRTENMLQSALLAQKHGKPQIDWDGVWIAAVMSALVVVPYLIAWWRV